MPNDNGALDAKLTEQLVDHRGLPRRRCAIGARQALAPAAPRPVDQDDAMPAHEPITEREPHILEIAAGAVEQDEREVAGRGPFAGIELNDMQAAAVDIDEA